MTQSAFFPPDSLAKDKEVHEAHSFFYSHYLRTLGEEPLYPTAHGSGDIFRLLLFPSAVVRISGSGDERRVVCKRGTGSEGGVLRHDAEAQLDRPLSPAEAVCFVRLLARTEFWSMSSPNEDYGCDGWHAVLEGVSDGRYHLVDRWTPTGTAFAHLVQFMIELCPWTPQPSPLTKAFRWLRRGSRDHFGERPR